MFLLFWCQLILKYSAFISNSFQDLIVKKGKLEQKAGKIMYLGLDRVLINDF